MLKESPQVLGAMNELLKHFGIYMGNVWHVTQVHRICKESGLAQLTDEQAYDVLELAGQRLRNKASLSEIDVKAALIDYMHRVRA